MIAIGGGKINLLTVGRTEMDGSTGQVWHPFGRGQGRAAGKAVPPTWAKDNP